MLKYFCSKLPGSIPPIIVFENKTPVWANHFENFQLPNCAWCTRVEERRFPKLPGCEKAKVWLLLSSSSTRWLLKVDGSSCQAAVYHLHPPQKPDFSPRPTLLQRSLRARAHAPTRRQARACTVGVDVSWSHIMRHRCMNHFSWSL